MPLIEDEISTENEDNRRKRTLSKKTKRMLKYLGIFLLIVAVLCFLLAFIGLPIIVMKSIVFQRLLMFTNLGLPSDQNYFKKYELKPGLRNLYVSVKDKASDKVISLGVWHLLPFILESVVITEIDFDFDTALLHSNRSVVLYFHGTGEDRSSSLYKYAVLRYFFHVITFDYRSYADSTQAELSEDAVVSDCVQLYEWLTTKTNANIYIWGHSLGTALASRTAAIITSKPNITQPVGVILEAPFTKMSEEIYVHPYGKIFSWLPWFKVTIVEPLQRNGFVFDNSKHVANIKCPIMILCSEDDRIVPYTFGYELYEIARNRSVHNTTLYYQFAPNLKYNHNFIYQDPFLPFFINYFNYICRQLTLNGSINWSKLKK